MADNTVEDPQLHNGAPPGESETEQHPTPESQSDHDPQLQTEAKLTDDIPVIETDAKPEELQSEITDSKPEQVQSEVNDVDLSPGGLEEIPIRSTEADQESSTHQTTHSVIKKEDEGNKTFTMRELLSELKSEEGDGTPHSSVSPFRFLSFSDQLI